MLVLAIGLVVFLVVHMVPALPGVRDGMVVRLGESGWKTAASVGSLVGLGLIIWGYSVAPYIEVWQPPIWLRHATLLLMLPVFPLLFESSRPGRLTSRIAHPMLLAVKIWAFAHLLVRGDAASMLLFATFLFWAVHNRVSMKRRTALGRVEVATGPVVNDYIALLGGLGFYVVFVLWGHQWLIGVSPIGR